MKTGQVPTALAVWGPGRRIRAKVCNPRLSPTTFGSITIAATGLARITVGKDQNQPVHPGFTDRLWGLAQPRLEQGRLRMDRAMEHLSVLFLLLSSDGDLIR